jgi:hypothetical protein
MATTTNYSWTTPDDTALVKDGAAAIRTLGSSIDTTTKNLNPETTLGDLAYRSSTANVKTRLGLGTAGQILQVNSGATAPEWATPAPGGGLTLISTTTLSGSSITLSSIPQTYKNLYILVRKFLPSDSGATLRFRLNGDSGTRYLFGTTTDANTITFTSTGFKCMDNGNNTVSDGVMQVFIPDYADSTTFQAFNGIGLTTDRDNTAAIYRYVMWGMYNQNTAITSIVIFPDFGTLTSGTVLLYGVN